MTKKCVNTGGNKIRGKDEYYDVTKVLKSCRKLIRDSVLKYMSDMSEFRRKDTEI